MKGNAKRTVFLLLALALPLSAQARGASVAAAQDPATQDPEGVDVLRGFSIELAHYVKDEWCGLDEPAMRLRWAEFGFEGAHLFRLPVVTEAALREFFRSSLDPDVVEHHPVLFREMSALPDFVKQIPQERFSEPSVLSREANSVVARFMSTEFARWTILFAARYGGYGSSDDPEHVRWAEDFRREFPEPSGTSVVCGEALTRAIDDVSPLRLGAAALFVYLSAGLSA